MIRVFNHWVYRKTLLRMLIDVFFPVTSVVFVFFHWGLGDQSSLLSIILLSVVFAVAMVMFNMWLGLYRVYGHSSRAQLRARAVFSLYMSVPLAYGVFSWFPLDNQDHKILLLAGMVALGATLLHRVFALQGGRSNALRHRVLVIGTSKHAKLVSNVLFETDPDIDIVGFYPESDTVEVSVPPGLVLPRGRSLVEVVHQLRVDEIIVAVMQRRGGVMPLRELLDCKMSGVSVIDLATYYERALGQIRLDSLKAGWLIFGDGFRQGVWRSATKRLFDIFSASILLIIASPVMIVTAFLILLEDGSPIFYRQERVGLKGRLFHVVKFRSMKKDAEKDGKPRWATSNDQRVTKVGKIIRKLRIDELPQLFSVLWGEMSLVGPRPERPYFVDQLTKEIPFYAARHSVKPGVTGWAQVSYHYGASVDDSVQKLQYDLYYVKNHTLFLDLIVLFETVGVVLTGKGAQ